MLKKFWQKEVGWNFVSLQNFQASQEEIGCAKAESKMELKLYQAEM